MLKRTKHHKEKSSSKENSIQQDPNGTWKCAKCDSWNFEWEQNCIGCWGNSVFKSDKQKR